MRSLCAQEPGRGAGGPSAFCPPGSLPHSSPEPLGQTVAHAGHPVGPLPCGSWDRRPGTAWRGRAQAPSAPPPRRSRGSQERRGAGGAAVRDAGSLALRCPGLSLSRPALPVHREGAQSSGTERLRANVLGPRVLSPDLFPVFLTSFSAAACRTRVPLRTRPCSVPSGTVFLPMF